MTARTFDADATWPRALLAALPSAPLPVETISALACATVAELQRLHTEGYAQGSVDVVQVDVAAADTVRLRLHGVGEPAAALGNAVRGDLQALGQMLYRCATGRAPTAHPALRRTLPDLPRALCDVIAALCQSDAVRPYRSAAGARADLELAAALLLDGQVSDTFSLARREPRAA